jgi:hypothetical protein
MFSNIYVCSGLELRYFQDFAESALRALMKMAAERAAGIAVGMPSCNLSLHFTRHSSRCTSVVRVGAKRMMTFRI